MMNFKRILAFVLSLCMVLSLAPMSTVFAEEIAAEEITDLTFEKLDDSAIDVQLPQNGVTEETLALEQLISDDEIVKVLIIMDGLSVVEMDSKATLNAGSEEIIAELEEEQAEVVEEIEETVLEGEPLQVNYNYTWLLNGVAANVPYGSIKEILEVEGVKQVLIQPVYQVCETAQPHTITDGVMVGRESTWAAGYTGEGMKIAIIDTGLDTDHPNFAALGEDVAVTATADTVASVLAELNATASYGELSASDVYYNTKVAYGFNYVDNNLNITHDYDQQGSHGTHVAGIAAANKIEGVDVVGVAPDAQLYVMKVFGANGGAYTEDILAALEDALLLGADVVNMSLGSPAGFTNTADVIMAIYNRVAETNTVLSVSAGNNYTAGYSNNWGTDKNLTANPDNAVIGQPAVYNNVMSVASVENLAVQREYILVSNGYRMCYNDTSVNYARPAITSMTGEYDFVFVPNYGAPEDFEGLDLTGKIAMVSRGDISFFEKVDNAAAAGAIACIVYNNTDGEFGMDLTDCESDIPAISILLADAAYLYSAKEEDAALTISFPTEVAAFPSATAYQMSEFSSWGVAPDLSLEPDITAPGGNIYSTVDGGYGLMSGTSMAAPNISGLTALVMQHIKQTMPEVQDVRTFAQHLLTSTAAPLPYDSNSFYSPRHQGTGLANAFNAVTTKTYLTVNGMDMPKVELGDDADKTGAYAYSFNVHNFGESKAFYDVETIIQSENVDAYSGGYYFMAGSPIVLPGATSAASTGMVLTHDVDDNTFTNSHDAYLIYQAAIGNKAESFVSEEFRYDTDCNAVVNTDDVQAYLDALVGNESVADLTDESLCVAAGETATVDITVALANNSMAFLDAYFPNGIYVEGFTFLSALNEGTMDLSLPYLGFYGDWDAAPMLDSGAYWDVLNGVAEYSQYPNILFTELGTQDYYPGANVYIDELIDPAHISLSPNGDGYFDTVSDIYLSLMRNASLLTYSFTDVTDPENPEVLYQLDVSNVSKSVYVPAYDQIVPEIYSWYEGQVPLYNWKDVDGQPLENNDVIQLDITATGAYEGATPETWSVPITIDLEAPELLAAQVFMLEDGTKLLGLAFRDNLASSVVGLLNSNGQTVYGMVAPESFEDIEEDEEGYRNYTAYFNITGLTGKLMLILSDYAVNEAYYGINLGGEGTPYGQFIGYSYSFGYTEEGWVSFDTDVDQDEVQIFMSDANIVAAEYVGGYVFAQDDTGALYGFKYEDMLKDTFVLESTFVAQLDNVYQDMAYSYKEGKLYGMLTYEDNDGYPTTEINSININGQYYDENLWMDVAPYQEDNILNRGGLYGLTMAIDDDGNLYVMGIAFNGDYDENDEYVIFAEDTASLWMVPCEYDEWSESYMLGWMLTKLGNVEQSMDFLQSMTWDHNTEKLYWARMAVEGYTPVSELYVVDAEWTVDEYGDIIDSSVTTEKVGTLSGEICGLFAPLGAEAAAKEEHANIPEMDPETVGTPILRDSVVTMNVTGTKKLTYDLDPWYTNHKNVVWSSSDESVVTVDENGVICCLSAGSATVTVANAADETKLDTVEVQVTALDLSIEGVITAQGEGVGATAGVSTYKFDMVDGISEFATVNPITAPDELNYGLSLATSAMGRGSLWACEYGNTGMIYEIDADTGSVKDVLMPIDGDMMFGLSYSESQDTFTGIMNMYIYGDLQLTAEESEEMMNSYDEDAMAFTYHRINMLPYLLESGGNFVTGETGQGASSEVVFCGITTIEGGDVTYLSKDYMGNWSAELTYIPTQTLVLLDNVGRLWFVDEIKNMAIDSVTEWGTSFVGEDGSFVSTEFHGVEYIETAEGVYSVFVIRELAETPMTDMFRDNSMPRITYHFSDIELAGFTADGAPMIIMSLYDYWNNGTTNELYLYIPGVGTGEFEMDENWNYVEIKTPDRLYSLGNTGEYNIIASVHSASVTGGIDDVIDNVQTEEEYMDELGIQALAIGTFKAVE